MTRRWLVVCALFSLLLAACGSERPAAERTRVRLAVGPFLGHAPLHVALEKGYFAEQGLDVELVSIATTREAVPPLVAGRLEVLAAGVVPTSIFSAIAEGSPIRVVADRGFVDPEGCPYSAFVARRELVESGELDDPRALRGKRISYSPSIAEGFLLERLVEGTGVGEDDIVVQEVDEPVLQEAFSSGALDLAFTSEPWITRIVEAGAGRVWMPLEESAPGFQQSLIVFGRAFIEEDPDAGERFMTAYLKAHRELRQERTEEHLEIMAEVTELEPDFLEQVCWQSLRPGGEPNLESIDEFQEWAAARGDLDRVVERDDYWEPRFVDAAALELGPEQ